MEKTAEKEKGENKNNLIRSTGILTNFCSLTLNNCASPRYFSDELDAIFYKNIVTIQSHPDSLSVLPSLWLVK